MVDYGDAHGELWQWGATEVITMTSVIKMVWYDPDGEWMVIRYDDGNTELRDFDNQLAPFYLGLGITNVAFSADNTWLLARYESGKLIMFDIDWLRFMAEDGNKKSINELVDHACKKLLSDPDLVVFDPVTLKPYLDGILPDGQPQACPELYDSFFQNNTK